MSHQAAFAAALLDPQLPCPDGLCSANGADPASRFAVYRNNVQSSLINALADSYPVVQQLVGEEFFRAMAAVFVQQHPPESPLMSRYGEALPDFIAAFEPAASVPYLADVARLERLRTLAYHAADALPVRPEQITAALADPQSAERAALQASSLPAPARLAYAVVAIWAAHQQDATLDGIDTQPRATRLVLRNGLDVEVFAVEPGASVFHPSPDQWPTAAAAAENSPPFDLAKPSRC